MSTLRDIEREMRSLKASLSKEAKGGYTQKEKRYYRTHPVEFAETEIFFKKRRIRLSSDQAIFMVDLMAWDPAIKYDQDDWDNLTEESEVLQESERIIVVASRNGGKTFILAVYALWRALFWGNLWIREMGGSMPQAKIFYHQYFKVFIEANPKMLAEVKGQIRAERTEFKNGTAVEMSACSETASRGPHPDILLLDEVAAADKAKKTDVIKAALDSALGQIVMASTAHHVSGLFVQYLSKAELYGYKVFRWPVCDIDINGEIINIRSPWITKDRIEHARLTKSENEFNVEWMAEVGNTASMVFPLTYVEKAEVKMEESVFLSEFEENLEDIMDGVEQMVLDNVPEHLRRFYEDDFDEDFDGITIATYGGVDIGFVHPTAIVILYRDVDDVIWVVHEENYRGRDATWRAGRVKEVQDQYKVDQMCLDGEDVTFFQLCVNEGANVRTVPFQNYKTTLIGTLRNLFEKERIKIPTKFETLLDQLKSYTYGANQKPIKGNDDSLDALLFALFFYSQDVQGGGGFESSDVDLW